MAFHGRADQGSKQLYARNSQPLFLPQQMFSGRAILDIVALLIPEALCDVGQDNSLEMANGKSLTLQKCHFIKGALPELRTN